MSNKQNDAIEEMKYENEYEDGHCDRCGGEQNHHACSDCGEEMTKEECKEYEGLCGACLWIYKK